MGNLNFLAGLRSRGILTALAIGPKKIGGSGSESYGSMAPTWKKVHIWFVSKILKFSGFFMHHFRSELEP